MRKVTHEHGRAMTIPERKAREEDDRARPWAHVSSAATLAIGEVCQLRVNFGGGPVDMEPFRFAWDGRAWFQVEPAKQCDYRVIEYRPVGVRLDPGKMRELVTRASFELEIIGGEIRRRPEPHKLYWRADD